MDALRLVPGDSQMVALLCAQRLKLRATVGPSQTYFFDSSSQSSPGSCEKKSTPVPVSSPGYAGS